MSQVVAARYESGSIVLTTNRAFKDLGKIFDFDNTLATAMIDRLMYLLTPTLSEAQTGSESRTS